MSNQVLPGLFLSLWLSMLLFWGMLWSLKFTGDAEMKTAHLLLLQIKTRTPILHGTLLLAVRNCGCTSPPLQTDAA